MSIKLRTRNADFAGAMRTFSDVAGESHEHSTPPTQKQFHKVGFILLPRETGTNSVALHVRDRAFQRPGTPMVWEFPYRLSVAHMFL